ncbi:cuticle protein 67 [Cryptotermes secundus]|uniref:cuticle protein 67 n=1 Tax=Cryptotermes secundus TaxID=105785 RepID=UPI000CD7BE09|nr:cuticle protein 67 [Cryptotermes secundus]
MYKFFVLAALVAVTKAGYIGAPAVSYAAAPAFGYAAPAAVAAPAITSQQSNILRSYGNLGQVSTYSKTIDTPYSSVRKSDVRVSNDALAYPAAPAVAAYAAPVAYRGAYAAPVAAAAHGLLGVAYSAAPAVAHISYSNAYGINYAY